MFATSAWRTNPVIVAPLMTVVWFRMKSSAVSVSILPELSLRESAPRLPSAEPVVKKKESAKADVVAQAPAASSSAVKLTRNLMSLLRVDVVRSDVGSSTAELRRKVWRANGDYGPLLSRWFHLPRRATATRMKRKRHRHETSLPRLANTLQPGRSSTLAGQRPSSSAPLDITLSPACWWAGCNSRNGITSRQMVRPAPSAANTQPRWSARRAPAACGADHRWDVEDRFPAGDPTRSGRRSGCTPARARWRRDGLGGSPAWPASSGGRPPASGGDSRCRERKR